MGERLFRRVKGRLVHRVFALLALKEGLLREIPLRLSYRNREGYTKGVGVLQFPRC